MNEVDVLVVFSNRYHYGINSIDVEVVKTRFCFSSAWAIYQHVTVNKKSKKPRLSPTHAYFPGENFGKKSNETAPSYLGNVKYI